MSGITDIKVLHAALKDAEDELCSLGHVLVHEGWNTDTIALTLDVIRIALYGTDGSGNGPEGFQSAQARLAALRAEEYNLKDAIYDGENRIANTLTTATSQETLNSFDRRHDAIKEVLDYLKNK